MAKNVYNGIELEMNNTQKTFCPHWIIRFTDSFVVDLNKQGIVVKNKKDLFKLICERLGLDYQKHDMYAQKVEQQPQTAKADNTLGNYVLTQIKAGQTESQIIATLKTAGWTDDKLRQTGQFKSLDVISLPSVPLPPQ